MFAGLDVPVEHADGVGLLQALEQLLEDLQAAQRSHRTMAVDDLGQRQAIDVLEDHVQLTIRGAAEVVHHDRMGVAQHRQQPGLTLEATHRRLDGVVVARRREDLQGDHATDVDLLGSVHLSEAPRTDLRLDQVATLEELALAELHRSRYHHVRHVCSG